MKTNQRDTKAAVKVTTGVKAGAFSGTGGYNHNRRAMSLSVRTGIKAGSTIAHANHNRRLA